MYKKLKIAIQPDESFPKGVRQSYSERWSELCLGVDVEPVLVDIFSENFMHKVSSCDAFMWRPSIKNRDKSVAVRLVPAIEYGMGMPCFFSSNMTRAYQDKVTQFFELAVAGISVPDTKIFWSKKEAYDFCKTAKYPLVMKLSSGRGSGNVVLLKTFDDAKYYIEIMFGPGAVNLGYRPASKGRMFLRRGRVAYELIKGNYTLGPTEDNQLHHGYLYLQRFLPKNDFDTRITIVGNRACGFRRFNREGDFRASGSPNFDYNPEKIDIGAVKLAFKLAKKLKMPLVAVDILKENDVHYVCEYNIYVNAPKSNNCPGFWVYDDSGDKLEWKEEKIDLVKFIFDDFLESIKCR